MMRNRASILLLGSALVLACVWIVGCGKDTSDKPAGTANKFQQPRRLEPQVPEPPPPNANVSGSLEPPAEPAPGTAAPGTEKKEPGAEKAAPAAEKAAPATEKAAPEAEKAAPEVEKAAPEAEKAAPEAEKAAPEAEKKEPAAEK